jgi:hypothetical protein
MGKKSDAPAAPDYGPLAAASEKSADYAFQLAQRQQDWAEKTYAENKGVSDIVISKALGALDQQTADAARDRARYESIYQPLEEQLAQEAQDYSTPERMEQEAGKAEADVAAQFEQARQTAQDRLEGFGVDPSQTRAGALDLGTRIAEAAAQSSAGNQARTNTENIGRALRSEAINVGRGYPGQIAGNMAGAGQAGNQAANTGLATTTSGANTMGTGGQWQGAGNQALAGWGNILNTGFSNQMDRFNANQDSSSGWGSLLGTVAGTFMGGPAGAAIGGGIGSRLGFAGGGAIPDEAGMAIPPEASPSGGAIPDDVPAQIEGGQPAQLNAGEFVIPEDVVKWVGEKGMQQFILKSRKEMQGGNGERPAQPQVGPPPIPADSVGAIPMPGG